MFVAWVSRLIQSVIANNQRTEGAGKPRGKPMVRRASACIYIARINDHYSNEAKPAGVSCLA